MSIYNFNSILAQDLDDNTVVLAIPYIFADTSYIALLPIAAMISIIVIIIATIKYINHRRDQCQLKQLASFYEMIEKTSPNTNMIMGFSFENNQSSDNYINRSIFFQSTKYETIRLHIYRSKDANDVLHQIRRMTLN